MDATVRELLHDTQISRHPFDITAEHMALENLSKPLEPTQERAGSREPFRATVGNETAIGAPPSQASTVDMTGSFTLPWDSKRYSEEQVAQPEGASLAPYPVGMLSPLTVKTSVPMDTSGSPGLDLLGGDDGDNDIWAMDIDSPSADDIGAVLRALDCSPRTSSKGLGGSVMRRSVAESGLRSSRLRFQADGMMGDVEVALKDQPFFESKVTVKSEKGENGMLLNDDSDTWMMEGGISLADGKSMGHEDRRLTFGEFVI